MTFAEASAGADLVVHAGSGTAALDLLAQAGDLAGTVLLDISNPLDFSAGFPPTLAVKDTDSLGEQIQRAFPEAKVVKTLNTLTAALMVEPRLAAGGDHSVFVSGNDEDAKRKLNRTENLRPKTSGHGSAASPAAPAILGSVTGVVCHDSSRPRPS